MRILNFLNFGHSGTTVEEPTAIRTLDSTLLSGNWNKNPRVPWNSSHWFLFPFNSYHQTLIFSSYFPGKKYAPWNFHAEDKHGAAPGRFQLLRAHQIWCRQLQLDTNQTHCRSSCLGGCPWLVLACLACAALFRVPKPWKNFSGPKHIFLPPASFAT